MIPLSPGSDFCTLHPVPSRSRRTSTRGPPCPIGERELFECPTTLDRGHAFFEPAGEPRRRLVAARTRCEVDHMQPLAFDESEDIRVARKADPIDVCELRSGPHHPAARCIDNADLGADLVREELS